MQLTERRRRGSDYWPILAAIVLQLVITVYSYGRLVQKVEDIVDRVHRIELQLNNMKFAR